MNVLLTSGGRRNYLVHYFKEALGTQGQVVVADADKNAAAGKSADLFIQLPPARSPKFVDELVRACTTYKIKLVVPLNDLELEAVSQALEDGLMPAGTRFSCSSAEVIQTCLDKVKAEEFLKNADIATTTSCSAFDILSGAVDPASLTFPVFVKPRWGSGSIGVEIAHDFEDLIASSQWISRKVRRTQLAQISKEGNQHSVIVQEMLAGAEYGLDVVNDLDGNYITTLARRKISMRAGETDRAEIVSVPVLHALGEKIGRSLRHHGNLDVDVMLKDGVASVIEMNPRFGGGYPFSHEAGANLPLALIHWTQGKPLPEGIFDMQTGAQFSKYELLMRLD